MEIFCACPFTIASLAWQPADAPKSLSVCVKATFVLAPGTSTLAAIQEPVAPEGASGDAPDLVPYKPRAEILFTGHAYAPNGGMTDSLIARARVGAFRKALSINGDRAWVPSFDGLRPSNAVAFRRMPLVYERAVRTGENLTGVDISRGATLNAPLANIAAIADQGGETPGLSPLPFGWRTHRLGLTDHAVLWAARAGLALGPPPPRFDFRVFNAAPFEQQVDEIPPACDVLLENLHPQFAQLETRLPWVRVKLFQKVSRDEPSQEIPVRCDTLWIDIDRGLAITLSRGLARPDQGGWLVVTADTDTETTRAPDVDRMLAALTPLVTYVEPRFLTGRVPSPPEALDPAPVTEEPAPARRASTTLVPPPAEEALSAGALPFRTDAAGAAHAADVHDPTDLDAPTPSSTHLPASVDEELTPPRGYPAPPAPLAAPVPVPTLADGVYAAVRMAAWRGSPLEDALRRHGVRSAEYSAFEDALEDAIALEARSGASAQATALLDALFASRG